MFGKEKIKIRIAVMVAMAAFVAQVTYQVITREVALVVGAALVIGVMVGARFLRRCWIGRGGVG